MHVSDFVHPSFHSHSCLPIRQRYEIPCEVSLVALRRAGICPEKTPAEFPEDGHFITRDLGRFDSGGCLHIVSQSKDLIISGGCTVR